MLLLMFILAVLFGAICLYIGYSQASFPMAYLGMFVFLVIGLMVLNEGIAFENGTQEVPLGSHNFVTTYETRTAANDSIVGIIGNTFFYLAFVGVLLSTFFALRGMN